MEIAGWDWIWLRKGYARTRGSGRFAPDLLDCGAATHSDGKGGPDDMFVHSGAAAFFRLSLPKCCTVITLISINLHLKNLKLQS